MDGLRWQIRALTTLQLLTLLLLIVFISRGPDKLTETKNNTVYVVGEQGPHGIPGVGIKGEAGVSVVGPVGPLGPVGPRGGDAEPCTTTQDAEGDTYINCPDGSSSTIAKPKDGKDGQDGQDGRSVEFRTNPETCDVEYKYTTNRTWEVLVEQECEDGS